MVTQKRIGCKYEGLSSDTKPDAPVNSVFLELDTGSVYVFNGEEWISSGATYDEVTGEAPMSLPNAVEGAVKSLVQYGKVSTGYCNNGEITPVDDELPTGYKRLAGIKFDGDTWYDTGEVLTGDDNVTMTLANTSSSGQNVFGSYNGTTTGTTNFSLYLYGGGSSSNCYFRYGEQLLRPKFGSNEHTITFGHDGTSGFDTDVTATPDTFTTVASAYIGMLPNSSSPAYTGSILGNIYVGTRLVYIPCEDPDGKVGYYEKVKGVFLENIGTGSPTKGSYDTTHQNSYIIVGTPEVITLGEQTASCEDLFATDDVADEQDIISGVVTRNTEVVVSGGTVSIQALGTPVTEKVSSQPLRTSSGTNTVSVVSNVDPVTLKAVYRVG